MGDIHLINLALAGSGIAACAAILLAALIITIAAIRQHRVGTRPEHAHAPAQIGRSAAGELAEREPALH